MASSHVFAGVGGYYGGNQGNLAGVFRRDAAGADWQHVLTEPEAYTVFVHPRDPNLVLAGTKDGIYRSTDGGATFKRANFPDNGVQVWSFLPDPADRNGCLPAARRLRSIAAPMRARAGRGGPIRNCRIAARRRSRSG